MRFMEIVFHQAASNSRRPHEIIRSEIAEELTSLKGRSIDDAKVKIHHIKNENCSLNCCNNLKYD